MKKLFTTIALLTVFLFIGCSKIEPEPEKTILQPKAFYACTTLQTWTGYRITDYGTSNFIFNGLFTIGESAGNEVKTTDPIYITVLNPEDIKLYELVHSAPTQCFIDNENNIYAAKSGTYPVVVWNIANKTTCILTKEFK